MDSLLVGRKPDLALPVCPGASENASSWSSPVRPLVGQTFQPPVFCGLARAGSGDGQLSSCPGQVAVSKRGVHLGGRAEKVQVYVAQGLQKGSHERLVGIKSQRARLSVGEGCMQGDMRVWVWSVLDRHGVGFREEAPTLYSAPSHIALGGGISRAVFT